METHWERSSYIQGDKHPQVREMDERKAVFTVEAVGVPDVVLLLGRVPDAGRQSAEVQRFIELHELLVAVIDDCSRSSAVHSHRHVLPGTDQLHQMPRTCRRYTVSVIGGPLTLLVP